MICACGHDESLHARGHKTKSGSVSERLSCTVTDAAFKFCKCEQFRVARTNAKILNSEEAAQPAAEGVTYVMAKQKGRKVVLFEVTSKKADELLDKENQTNAAIFYRVLVAKEEAMTRQAIYEASKSKCESAAAWERLGHQTHDTLARLRKAGFVKRTETREEVKESQPKAKRVRKPRTKKIDTQAAATEASAAA